MKQVLLKNGDILVEDLPVPVLKNGEILVETVFSLISAGTELFGIAEGSSLIKKVLSSQENFKKGMNFLMGSGLKKTLEFAQDQKSKSSYLGYSLSIRYDIR